MCNPERATCNVQRSIHPLWDVGAINRLAVYEIILLRTYNATGRRSIISFSQINKGRKMRKKDGIGQSVGRECSECYVLVRTSSTIVQDSIHDSTVFDVVCVLSKNSMFVQRVRTTGSYKGFVQRRSAYLHNWASFFPTSFFAAFVDFFLSLLELAFRFAAVFFVGSFMSGSKSRILCTCSSTSSSIPSGR